MQQKFYCIFFIFFCLACQNETDKHSATVADDICTCFQPLIEVNTKIQSLLKKGAVDKAEKLITKVNTLNQKGEKCALDNISKHEAIQKVNIENTRKSIAEMCPKILPILDKILLIE